MRGRRLGVALIAAALLAGACGGGSDDGADRGAALERLDVDACDWPIWGHGATRTFATRCESEITAATAPRLMKDWFVNTRDVVTASPAVVDGTVYVGDWSGRFYAIDIDGGDVRWTFDAPVHPTVYSGQIVSSAAVAQVGPDALVFVGAGRTMYALDANTGAERWHHDVNPDGDDADPSEIETSPVVADGMVLFGFDAHNQPGVRVGVKALDARTGAERWYFDPDRGATPTGCNDAWGSPAIDIERRAVFFGTGNCNSSPTGWGPYTEALVALDLDDGTPRWSFQPHEPNNDDFDFAGAPNLFTADGRAVVGLGNKDGHYYAVDRTTGKQVWDTEAAAARVPNPNFSSGGFIGGTAVAGSTIVGGTAVGGPCPCLHGLDAATGRVRWQQDAVGPTFASSAAAGDVAFVGSTTDFTLRAIEVASGKVLWKQTMTGGVAGGVAITRDRVVAVAGIREPGLGSASRASGVTSFRLGEVGSGTTSTTAPAGLPPTTQAPPPGDPITVPGEDRACVAAPCEMSFSLKTPPAGTDPRVFLHVRPDPFRLEVRGDGLGDPEAWIRPGGAAAATGAVTYGVFVSERDDNPAGTMVCVLDASFDCVTDVLPVPLAPTYNRITVIAIEDSIALPDLAEGFDRLVTTQAFDPPLVLG